MGNFEEKIRNLANIELIQEFLHENQSKMYFYRNILTTIFWKTAKKMSVHFDDPYGEDQKQTGGLIIAMV